MKKKFLLILMMALFIQGIQANTCSTATVLTVKENLEPDTFLFSGTEYWFSISSNTTVSILINNLINGNFAGINEIVLYSGSCTGRQITLYSRTNPDTIFMFRYTFTAGIQYYLKLVRQPGLGDLYFSALGTIYQTPTPNYCNYTDCQYIKNGSFSIVDPTWNQLAFFNNINNLDHTAFCGWQRAWGMPHIIPIIPPTTNPCAFMISTNDDGGGAIVQNMSGRPLLVGHSYTITFDYMATGSNSGVINFVLPQNGLTYPLWNNVSDLLYITSPVPVLNSNWQQYPIGAFNSWVTNAYVTFTVLPGSSNYPTLVIDPQSNNSTQLNLWIDNVSITENFTATITANPPVLCSGGTTLTVNSNQIPPNPPYTYIWSTGATTQSIHITSNGFYAVTVTNAIGCTSVATIKNIVSSDLRASSTAIDATCGNCDGSINLTVNGGTSPYTYLWNTGATTPSISNLCPGTYSVTVTDYIGCTVSVSQAVGEDVFTNSHWPVVIPNNNCNGIIGNEVVSDLTTDALGNVYVIGTFTGQIVLGKDTFCSPAACNCKSIFVAKYDHCGNIVLGRYLGYVNTSSSEPDLHICKTPSSILMAIAGQFSWIDCTSGGNPMISGDGIDVFLAVINTSMLVTPSSSQQIQIHSDGTDNVKGISSYGNAMYIAGGFKGHTLYPGTFTPTLTNANFPTYDLYVCRFIYSLTSMPWDQRYGGIYSDNGMTMQATSSSNLAFTYMVNNISYINILSTQNGTFGTAQQLGTGSEFYLIHDMKAIGGQLFLCGYKRSTYTTPDNKVALIYYPNANNSIAWNPNNLRLSNNTNNPSTCEATKIAINGNNVFVSGTFDATNFKIGNNGIWSQIITLYGASDHFVYKTDNTLTPAAYWLSGVASGTGTSRGNAIAYDNVYGVYYLGGTFTGSITLTGSAGQSIVSNVGYDAFIARFIDNAQADYKRMPIYNNSTSSIVNSNIVVYPNPANNLLNVESDTELSGMLTIYNSLGKPVKSLTVTGTNIIIPVEDLSSGLYILKINDNKIRFSIVKH